MYETEQKKERVILVGISLSDAEDVDQSLDELEELARCRSGVRGQSDPEERTDPSGNLCGKGQA